MKSLHGRLLFTLAGTPCATANCHEIVLVKFARQWGCPYQWLVRNSIVLQIKTGLTLSSPLWYPTICIIITPHKGVSINYWRGTNKSVGGSLNSSTLLWKGSPNSRYPLWGHHKIKFQGI